MADILVVEDDEVFSRLLTMHLEDLGHAVKAAPSLDQARDILASSTADAILLDQQLPDGYGLDLLKEIKAEPDAPPAGDRSHEGRRL